MQLVENKLVTMRTKELIKERKKMLIPLWEEEKEEEERGPGRLHPCTRTPVKSAG